MNKNVGSIDRILRISMGMAIAGLGIYFKSWWGLAAVLPLTTGILSVCPAYLPCKLSTQKK
jgi:Inner membrane protein YgaP-like, transmembrane domain